VTDAMPERWLPVVGYEDLYAVSDLGRVKSFHSRGRWKSASGERLLSVAYNKRSGYAHVALCRDGGQETRNVHTLVLEAFVGPRPDGMEARHLDGDPANCALSNLRYGTSGENNLDQVQHGTHNNASKVACGKGHKYTAENTLYRLQPDGTVKRRDCRACLARRRQADRDLEKQPPASGGERCIEEGCPNRRVAKGLCRKHYGARWQAAKHEKRNAA
jgi:hypothetical protein